MSGSTTFFTNTYSHYKAYTSDVCQWLFTAAGVPMEADQPNGIGSNPPAPPPQGRLKGKARKLAKTQAASPSAQQNPQSAPVAHISVSRLVELAQNVASMPDKVSNMPKMIISKLKKAIELRRQYLALYTTRSSDLKTPDATLRAKNESHAHFVHTLERVLRILQPHSPSHLNDTGFHSKDDLMSSDPSPLQKDNRFNVLDVDDMDEDENHAAQTSAGAAQSSVPNHSKAKFSGKPQPKAVLVDETDANEIMFRIFCLFTDMHRLKLVLRNQWKQYKAGSIGLETVALMTELSITSIRNQEKDLIAVHMGTENPAKEFGYAELGLPLFEQLTGAIPSNTGADESTPSIPRQPELADVVELTFLPVYSMLECLTRVVKSNHIPWCIPGHFGVYNRNADRSKMSQMEIMLHDRIILVELFSDFCALEFSKSSERFDDEFTKGFRKLYNPNSRNVPVWLVFASDCFLSTHEILGDDIARPFEDLQKAALQADASLTRFFESRQGQPKLEHWPESNTRNLHNFQTEFIRSTILGDLVREMKIRYKKVVKDTDDFIYLGPPNHFLKSHPIFSGLLLLRLRILFQDAGCSIAKAWGTVLYTSHAYNAFRQSGALDVVWPEIEWFISHYTPEKLFAGFLPTTPEQCFKSYNLLMGTSLSYFASNARRERKSGRLLQSRQGPRDWAFQSDALKILTDWSHSHDPASAKCPDHPSRLLARLMAIDQASVSSNQLRVVGIAGQILSFKSMMEDEMVCLRRDFLDLHFRCVDFLRKLRYEFDDYFTQLVGPGYIENENQLCTIVGYILAINGNTQKVLEELFKCKNSLLPNIRSVSIERAARVMKQTILASPPFEV